MAVVLALMITVQVAPIELVHPLQDANALLPELAGAVNVTDVPAL